jgi:alginate O-acetyltransferase complex protein AlgI
MLFCSWPFVQFFVVVLAGYWLAPWHRVRLTVALPGRGGAARPAFVLTGDEGRVWWLLAASFYFYASWSRPLALLIVASTLLDYAIGLGLEALQSRRLRRALLVLSLTANLGLLCYFKYSNFFLASLYDAFGWWHDPSRPLLDVLIPVGISFYTFEAINYIVEVYWRRVPAERNPAHLLFFVLFFPHLIAGPIVRARDFLPQIRRRKRWSWGRCQAGVELFLLGLVKKWVVADQLAVYADPVFAAPDVFGTVANWAALLAFTVEIYCDFSGYADMALGTAHLLGYKLAPNFNMPYLATSVGDYWRRNHISLSTWLRDYLFLPLMSSGRGGRWHSGRWRTCRSFLITMTLGGLWHGASWNFVLWGLLHGILLSLHHLFRDFCKARPRLDGLLQTVPGTALRMALTFFCVYQGFILFRAPTFATAAAMFERLWRPVEGPDVFHLLGYPFLGVLVGGVALCHVAGCRRWWEKLSLRLPTPVLGGVCVLALWLCMVLAPCMDRPFLYFQF